ncbi:MAG TPA: DUF3455 domain-containing protein [Anaerolineales bacterium]|nr:DUF3455 domain-containing protein [Anaerolineales bacterium]
MLYTKLKSKWVRTMVRFHVAGIVLAAVAAMAFAVPSAGPVYADDMTPPPVPDNIQVPAGSKLFLVGHAVGTQNYVCVPSGTGVRFVLFTPEAALFDDEGKQLTTHFFSPNPVEVNTDPKVISDHTIRAAWQDSRDSSTAWGQVKPGNSSSDPDFVEPGAIPWLLVTIVGRQDGPMGGDRLSETTFIQRLNTHGGLAPSTGCTTLGDLGTMAFVPYTTDYYFYKSTGSGN